MMDAFKTSINKMTDFTQIKWSNILTMDYCKQVLLFKNY